MYIQTYIYECVCIYNGKSTEKSSGYRLFRCIFEIYYLHNTCQKRHDYLLMERRFFLESVVAEIACIFKNPPPLSLYIYIYI